MPRARSASPQPKKRRGFSTSPAGKKKKTAKKAPRGAPRRIRATDCGSKKGGLVKSVFVLVYRDAAGTEVSRGRPFRHSKRSDGSYHNVYLTPDQLKKYKGCSFTEKTTKRKPPKKRMAGGAAAKGEEKKEAGAGIGLAVLGGLAVGGVVGYAVGHSMTRDDVRFMNGLQQQNRELKEQNRDLKRRLGLLN